MPEIRALTLALVVVGLSGCTNEPSDGDTTDTTDATETDADTTDATDTTEGETGTTEGETDTGTDTGGIGEADELASAACDAFANATPQMVVAAASAGEAATATLVPDGEVVYRVALPEGAAGFVEVQLPDWQTTQAFFTDADIDYTVSTTQNSEIEGPRQLDGACPDAGITDQRIYFEHWTPATIEFSATGPRDILMMIIREP